MAKKRRSVVMGIDEAGRGPVLGPMVVCGVSVHEENLYLIESMGLKDSKKLSPKKREEFAALLEDVCRYEMAVLLPHEIDARVESEETLNRLEVQCFASLVRSARPNIAYLDACDVNAGRFGLDVRGLLDFEVEIISAHEADCKYPIVSAASILAKVRRDYLVEKISEEMGEDVGSGYPADVVTIEFLKSYYRKHKRLPGCCRKTWKTSAAIVADCKQSRLFSFE